MNPPLTQAEALTQLKLFTAQENNFTFTDDELTQALQAAWNDAYVASVVWDDSLTYTDGTWQYAVPDTMDVVRDIYTTPATNTNPDPVSSDTYDVVNGEIQFNSKIQRWLTTGQTLYLKGSYKLTSSDSLTTNAQVNYVINLAAQILLDKLLLKRAFVFLQNDTTTADIVRTLQVVQSNVLRYKQAILRQFEGS